MKSKTILLQAIAFVVCLSASVSNAAKDAEGYTHIENGAEELLTILEGLPYASEGEGPIVYVFEFSECTYCQQKYRDFNGQDLGVEYRRFFVPVSDRTSRETAALGKSRDPKDYHAYMRRQKVAPAFDRDNEAIDAYNAIVTAATQTIPPILKRNGWNARGLVFPAYFWIEDGKLFAQGGYTKENYARAMERAKSGWNEASRAFYASATGTAAPAAATAGQEDSAIGVAASEAQVAAPVANSQAPLPMDDLTVFLLYHKLSGEPIDYNAIVQHTGRTQRANQFDKANVIAAQIQELEAAFNAVDPDAVYQILVGGKLRYDMNAQRFESDLFADGVYLPFNPFYSGSQDYRFNIPSRAEPYKRRVVFANAENGRYIPLPTNEARVIDEVARSGVASVDAEISVRFVDTESSRIDSEKTLMAQVESVRYLPGAITIYNKNAWPFKDAMPLAEATMVADGPKLDRLDDQTVFYAYHKLAGKPVDFELFSGWMQSVARANQFDKARIQAEEAAGMRAEFEAIDLDKVYSLQVGTRLTYDLEKERFEVQFFEPGRHIIYRGLTALGADSRHLRGNMSALYDNKLVIANGDSARYIKVPKEKAALIGDTARMGYTQASAEMEVRLVGAGDPTGAVSGGNIVRAEVLSLKFTGMDLPVTIKPYDPDAVKMLSYNEFDVLGMRVGQDAKLLQKFLEKEFGDVGGISVPRNDDPRFASGIGHDPNGCYSFGNQTAETGNVCVRAYADDSGVIRKIVVEQILEGTDWEPIRMALLNKYGGMAFSNRAANIQHYAWGPEVTKTVTGDYGSQPAYALSASLSVVQSALDRMSASTRASTNLRIRLIDPDWAGAPEELVPAEEPAKGGLRL